MLPWPWGGLSPFDVLWQLFQSLFNWDFDSLGPHSPSLTLLSYLLNQPIGQWLWFKKYANSCIWPSSSFKNALSSLIYICLYFYSTFPNVSHFNPHKGKTEDLQFPFPPHPSPQSLWIYIWHTHYQRMMWSTHRGLFPSSFLQNSAAWLMTRCHHFQLLSPLDLSLQPFFFLISQPFIDYLFHFLLPPVEIIHWLLLGYPQ